MMENITSNNSYRISIPKFITEEEKALISIRVVFIGESVDAIAVGAAEFTDRWGSIYKTELCSPRVAFSKDNETTFIIRLDNKKSIYPYGGKVRLLFLQSDGYKNIVQYEYPDKSGGQVIRTGSLVKPMSQEENQYFQSICVVSNTKSNRAPVEVKGPLNKTADVYPELKPYFLALRKETEFLKNAGGTKHKISSGKFVKQEAGEYVYSFSIEAELYLSDDAPVKVKSKNGAATGVVLFCENFEILLVLRQYIGVFVDSAVMSVEPWKILIGLDEKLTARLGKKDGLAKNLIKGGPDCATRESINLISKGQHAVSKQIKAEPITIVWGPPGTGKTHMMSEQAIQFVQEGKSVLIVSHSNVSVDGVITKINELLLKKNLEELKENGDILRYGYIRDEELREDKYLSSYMYTVAQYPDLKQKLDELVRERDLLIKTNGIEHPLVSEIQQRIVDERKLLKTEERENVKKAALVATTISKTVIDPVFDLCRYDVVMFDEVSMAYVLQVVYAATLALERFLCVGDFMQLPPISQSPDAQGILSRDIFDYLKINNLGKPYYHPWLVMLNEQRRMAPQISEFPRKYMYEGLLEDHQSVLHSRDSIIQKQPFENQSITFLDLYGSYCAAGKNSDNSRFNILSALIVFSSAYSAEKAEHSVSVIMPYTAQTRLLRALTKDYNATGDKLKLAAKTVHQFQGSESDVVYFDAVESYPAKRAGWLMGKDFKDIRRLVNVAVTRAKGKLIVAANSRFWEDQYHGTQHAYYQLQSYLLRQGNVKQLKDRSIIDYVKSLSVGDFLQFYIDKNYEDTLLGDLKNANGSVFVSLPFGALIEDMEQKVFQCLQEANQRGVQVVIKSRDCENLPEKWKSITVDSDNAVFPLIVIDAHIVWYGALEEQLKFSIKNSAYHDVCKFIARVDGKETAELINSFTDLEYKEKDGLRIRIVNSSGVKNEAKNTWLMEYLSGIKSCRKCAGKMLARMGKRGNPYLKCENKNCDNMEWISVDDIRNYLIKNNVVCPHDGGEIKAGLGRNGLYLRCSNNHFLRFDEI